MQLKECYDAFGGDYKAIHRRLPKDESICKYINKFISEKSFEKLCKAVESGDYIAAFKAAHALKGLCADLGLSRLGKSVSILTEYLRDSEYKSIDKSECSRLLCLVQEDYNLLVDKFNSMGKAEGCPAFSSCGGCQYIDKTNAEQLNIKYKYISKLLAEFGKVEQIYGMENPYHYRNKNTATFKRFKSGDIIAGTYEAGSHRVVDSCECKLQDETANRIICTLKELFRSFKITIHNEDTGYGLIKHAMIRTAHATNQIMVVIVTNEVTFPSKKNFVKALVARHPEITTVVQNINDKHTTMVLGNRNDVMYGKGFIEDILCGKRFKLSPNSFYQINSVQTEILYNKAIEFANLTGNETVLDAYCGIGTIGIVASDKARDVIGVELNKDAVKDAIRNAKVNGCKNVSFYNNDAGRFMNGLTKQGKQIDVVFMDPPRSGSTEEFMNSVIELAPARIVYISCGPETLKRDLEYFTAHSGYQVKKIIACDLFPFTEHVETVCLLSKKS